MFATIRSLIPEPRLGSNPRRYVGKHRQPDPTPLPEPSPAASASEETQQAAV